MNNPETNFTDEGHLLSPQQATRLALLLKRWEKFKIIS